MISDRIPILVKTPREYEEIVVYASSDLHYGSRQFDDRQWYALEKMLKPDNAYIIFCGDLMDNATRSSKSNVYYSSCPPSEQKVWLRDRLEPFKDKILCVVPGNHEARTSKDVDMYPIYDVCVMLGIDDRYRQGFAVVDIAVGSGNGRHIDLPYRYTGYVCHKAQRLVNYGLADATEGIDFLLYGHTHRPLDAPLARTCYDRRRSIISERSVEMVNAGHFLTYQDYPAELGLRPTSQKKYKLILGGRSKTIQTVGFYI